MSGNVNFYTREEHRTTLEYNSCDSNDENEFWSLKILVYCLERIVFGNSLPPKISPEAIAAVQNALISLKTVFRNNPFLQVGQNNKRGGPGGKSIKGNSQQYLIEKDICIEQTSGMRHVNVSVQESMCSFASSAASFASLDRGNGNGLPAAATATTVNQLGGIGFEAKTILRTLVSSQLRNLARELIRLYQPMLESGGFKCNFEDGDESEGDQHLAEALSNIVSLIQNMKDECHSFDQQLDAVNKEIQVQSQSLEKNLNELADVIDRNIQYLNSESCPDITKRYTEYLLRRAENSQLKKCVFDLEMKLESNPPDLVKEVKETSAWVQNEISKLEDEIKASERLLEGYQSLGPEYSELLVKYKDIEEQIATKEWVIKQYDDACLQGLSDE